MEYKIHQTIQIILWILLFNVENAFAGYCYSYYYYYYYYCSDSIYWSVGTIVGAVIGGMIGMVILVVVLVVICSACKTQGNRGTVVRPLNQTTIHTVQNTQQQQPLYGHPPPPQYNQYPPPPQTGGAMYPPPQNMAYPPPPMGGQAMQPGQPGPSSGFSYNQPPPYTGAPEKT